MSNGVKPSCAGDGVPFYVEGCPSYDDKRCRVLGLKPHGICEPAVAEMVSSRSVGGGVRTAGEAQGRRERALAALDLARQCFAALRDYRYLLEASGRGTYSTMREARLLCEAVEREIAEHLLPAYWHEGGGRS